MTLRDELERVMGASLISNRRSVPRQDLEYSVRVANDFFRDHGPALLEALEDAERLNFADIELDGQCFSFGGDKHDSIRKAIDHDRAIAARRGGG